MIEKEFLESLKGLHPYEVIVGIGDHYMEKLSTLSDVNTRYKLASEIMAILADCGTRFKLNLGHPAITGGKDQFINIATQFIQKQINLYRERVYKEGVSIKGQRYGEILFGDESLSKSDIDEIQELLLKLRQNVSDTADLTDVARNKIIKNIEDIEKELYGITVDSRKLFGLLMPLWVMTKETKTAFDIVVVILQIATKGLEKQTGIPWKQMTQKFLE